MLTLHDRDFVTNPLTHFCYSNVHRLLLFSVDLKYALASIHLTQMPIVVVVDKTTKGHVRLHHEKSGKVIHT